MIERRLQENFIGFKARNEGIREFENPIDRNLDEKPHSLGKSFFSSKRKVDCDQKSKNGTIDKDLYFYSTSRTLDDLEDRLLWWKCLTAYFHFQVI